MLLRRVWLVVGNVRPAVVLALLLLVAFALRWGGSLFLPNVARPDEVFQNLEPAFGLHAGYWVRTWEWRDGIRSWLFPGFLAGLMRVAQWLGTDFRWLISGVLSAFSTAVVGAAFWVGWQHSRWLGALVCAGLCALWPDMIYFGPKTLTEVQAAYPLFVAATLAMALPAPSEGAWGLLRQWQRPPADETAGSIARRCGAIGLLLGWSFCLRFHLAPAFLLVALWACQGAVGKRWLPLLLGGLIPVAALGIVDAVAWGTPFQSILRNYAVNIVEQRSHQYGVHPLHWYVLHMVRHWGVALPVLAVCFGFGARRSPLLAAIAAVTLASHMAIAHKEWSFIHAGLAPALVVSGIGAVELLRRLGERLRVAPHPVVLGAFGVAATIGLCASTALSGAYWTEWRMTAPTLRALDETRRRTDLCGLILFGDASPWWDTGYAYLRHPVPIYLARTRAELSEVEAGGNYLLVSLRDVAQIAGYEKQECWSWETCLLRRAQTCSPVATRLEVNEWLRQSGQ